MRTTACAGLLAFVAVPFLFLASAAAQEAAPAAGKHAALYARLCRTTDMEFEEVPLATALEQLSQELGAEIVVDPAVATREKEKLQVPVTLHLPAPAAFHAVIRVLLSSTGVQARLTLDGDTVRLDDPAREDVYTLQSHSLAYFSNYTTPMRPVLIEQIRSTIAPATWDKSDAFIAAAPSVAEIDVYHTVEVHQRIDEFCYSSLRHTGDWERKAELQDWIATLTAGKEPTTELEQALKRLREMYPYRSLSKRLEGEAGKAAEVVLGEWAEKRLEEREEQLSHDSASKYTPYHRLRSESLKELHVGQVEDFIGRNGFGVTRMPQPGPYYYHLPATPKLPLASVNMPRTGEIKARVPKSKGEAAAAGAEHPTWGSLAGMHVVSEQEFFKFSRFGYVKDKDHVAGFAPHAFTYPPRLAEVDGLPHYAVRTEQWALSRLELVSLIKHKKPVVYESKDLPRMEELGAAPTRALSTFESEALLALRGGEDVHVRATTNRIEMVGALRAIKQCADCHDAERGQLMGAFSYELVRDPPRGDPVAPPAARRQSCPNLPSVLQRALP